MNTSVHQNTSVPQYYTYLLINSLTGKVFYVGKGVANRFYSHEDEARRGIKSAKCDAIRQIWADGGQVIKTKVGEFEREVDAFAHETLLMRQHRDTIVNCFKRNSTPKKKNFSPFGELLSHICKRLGINQSILAREVGIHQTTISKMEGQGQNVPQRETIIAICEKLREYPKWDDEFESMLLQIAGYCTNEQQKTALIYVQDMQDREQGPRFIGSLFQ